MGLSALGGSVQACRSSDPPILNFYYVNTKIDFYPWRAGVWRSCHVHDAKLWWHADLGYDRHCRRHETRGGIRSRSWMNYNNALSTRDAGITACGKGSQWLQALRLFGDMQKKLQFVYKWRDTSARLGLHCPHIYRLTHDYGTVAMRSDLILFRLSAADSETVDVVREFTPGLHTASLFAQQGSCWLLCFANHAPTPWFDHNSAWNWWGRSRRWGYVAGFGICLCLV